MGEIPDLPPPPPPEPASDGDPAEAGALRQEDLDLARDVLAGDAAALDRFITRMRCVPRILTARNQRIGRPLQDHELADLTQDVLALVWSKLGDFAGQAALESWAYRFCENELMNALRKKRRLPRALSQFDLERGGVPEPAADDATTIGTLAFDHVYRCLDKLPPIDERILRAKHFEDRTFEDIAERMAASTNTIKSRYYRALRKLRQCLGSSGADPDQEGRS